MRIVQTFFDAVHLIETPRYHDERGWFGESQRQAEYAKLLNLSPTPFVQSNVSYSKTHVLRGLHAQKRHPQGKLIQVLSGSVFDVFVDVRRHSPSFGQWHSVLLGAEHSRQLWLPPGFAHGFLTVADNPIMLYHCTDYFAPDDELILRWDDPDLNINWPLGNRQAIVSPKDQTGMTLKDYIKCEF